jgi:hypothetical protein
MNSSAASAMMRFLSSEGWNEKSKPASVLIDDRGKPLARLTGKMHGERLSTRFVSSGGVTCREHDKVGVQLEHRNFACRQKTVIIFRWLSGIDRTRAGSAFTFANCST